MNKFRVASVLYENIDEIDKVQFIDEFKSKEVTDDVATDDEIVDVESDATEDNANDEDVQNDTPVEDDTNIDIEFVDEIDVEEKSPEVLRR